MATTSDSTQTVSIVVPCYQDADNLPRLFEALQPVMSSLPGCELVLVDDGSRDDTYGTAVRLAGAFPFPVVTARLVRNFGQQPAVFAGLSLARGNVVVTIDSDLQYSPAEIPLLVAELSPDFPVVSGWRNQRSDPWLRRRLSRILTWWLGRKTGVRLRDYGSMFRAYDRAVVETLLSFQEQRRYIPAMVGWLQIAVKEVPVSHGSRRGKRSRYRFGPLLDMALDLFVGYSTFPLRWLTAVGLFGFVAGMLATIAFVIYRIVIGAGISRLVTAFALLFFLIGIQMLLIGMIGEYVGRIYAESKGRPYYIVASVDRNNA
jgi:undecaprenyl-phosphate 4-deoxy-4-formamido-L-arabinose transferase